ncbi:MAG: EAL domain-containing protein [Sulfurimonas sp.]|nr:EAL domain-containing protein [Sulfurimonas sp.]
MFVIALSSTILYSLYSEKKNLEYTKHHILQAETLSRVTHYMQIERGVTTGLITSSNIDGNSEQLLDAKKNTDRAIDDAIARVSLCEICTSNGEALELLGEIKSREEADLLRTSAVYARDYYTKKISSLHTLIQAIPSLIDDRENRNYIQSYSYLSSAKEALGQNRAILVEVFTNKEFLNSTFMALKQNIKIYSIDTQSFITVASKKVLYFYNEIFKGEAVEETFTIIDAAVKNSDSLVATPSYWFEKSTETINLLKKVEEKLFSEVNILINEKLDATSYKLTALLLFLTISAVVVTFLIVLTVRKILFSANALESEYDNSLLLLEQYKSTVDRSFIVSKSDANGIITYVNDEFCNITGYSKDELLGKPHNIVRHPDMSKETFKDLWHTVKDLKQPWFGNIKNRKKDGSYYWVKAIINPIMDNNGNIVEYIGIRTDITQQQKIAQHFQEQLMVSVKNFDSSLHLLKEYEKAIDISAILSRTGKEGNITYANNKFLEITEYSLNELLGKSHNILKTDDTDEKLYKNLWTTITKGKVWQGILKNRAKSGREFWVNVTIVPIKDIGGTIVEYLAIRTDVTKIMQHKKELEEFAKTDSLTGHGNRFQLNCDIENLLNPSIAVFNIDNFRQINDFYGHQFGDLVIISIANKIYNLISKENNLSFYRLQGDEFVILATNTPKEEFISKSRTILNIITEKFSLNNEEILLSCSCGISFEYMEHLLSSANMALNVAKKSNVDFLVYDESLSLNSKYENNITWTRKLSNALKTDNIVAYYQPIVNNSDISNKKYECLVRMIDDGKVISPFFFLDIAKQTRQYFDITKTVIYQAFEMFKDKNIEFSINLSINDILEANISDYILMMLEKYDIGSKVVFEIVESEYIENVDGVLNFIAAVKKYECKIAIDDFGTGYSNFEYLIKLKADYLKIDGSLIKNMDSDQNAFLVVSTIVDFSKKLGMKTIAEFVESEAIFKIVKDLGIDYSQGYYFSAPKNIL